MPDLAVANAVKYLALHSRLALSGLVLGSAFTLSIAAGAALAKPPAIHWPTTNPLPQTQTNTPNLISVTAWDALGHKLTGVSASVPPWDRTGLPFFPVAIPQSLRVSLMLRASNAWSGWLVVPKGWVPYHTTMLYGVGGPDDASFVAPAGKAQGWMIAVEDHYYAGDDTFAGNGFFPDAKALIFGSRDAPHPPPPPASVTLAPAPSSIARPSGCIIELTYPSHNLTVRAAALISPYRQPNFPARATYAADLDEIFVAMPRGESSLQDFIVGAFLAEHDQHTHCTVTSP